MGMGQGVGAGVGHGGITCVVQTQFSSYNDFCVSILISEWTIVFISTRSYFYY